MLLAYFVTAIASAILTYLTTQYLNKRKERVEIKHHERGVWKGTGKNTKDIARAISVDLNMVYGDSVSVSSHSRARRIETDTHRNVVNRNHEAHAEAAASGTADTTDV